MVARPAIQDDPRPGLKRCPCGRPTASAYHDHAVCIRTAPTQVQKLRPGPTSDLTTATES